MGLDMYAYTAPANSIDKDVDFEKGELPELSEIHYWRKHPNLHGWMAELYVKKGGTAETFNCTPVRLSASDLDELENAIKGGELPPTSGFFFGESIGDETEDDLEFIAKARAAIEAGDAVLYDSWW